MIKSRVSTANQVEVEFNSCEAQEAKIKSFIKSQENISVFKVYSDPGFSGANLNRPALQELLNDIREYKINLVISYKIDRLTRSPKDFYQLIELFDKYGVDFISVTERFDTSTPSGRLLRNIMLTFAQFERELASERTKDKMLQRAQKGMWNKKRKGRTKHYYYYRCTKTFKENWDSCSLKQVNANRIEDYIFKNLERISTDKHYIDSLIFKLNNSQSDDRIGLELSSESPKISAEIFGQTLRLFVKGVSQREE